MNSCIYEVKIGHYRQKPVKNGFTFSSFFFYLDLDEIDELVSKYNIFSINKWNIFSFFDKDHFTFTTTGGYTHEKITKEKIAYDASSYEGKTTKQNIQQMIQDLHIDMELGKVYLLTNPRNRGYVFNPVSFYYCFDTSGTLRVLFSEVNNTFHQQKMYYIENTDPHKTYFRARQKKNYYVSPFIDYDTDLTWEFEVPGESLRMYIDSVRGEDKELRTSVVGKKRPFTEKNLWYLVVRYPLLTLMIILYIHRQALKLRYKGVHFYKKDETDNRIVQDLEKQTYS